MHDGKWVNLHIKLQYKDARIDALQATKKHEVRDSKVSGTIFIYPLTWLRRSILDLIWWWKSCSTSAIWHVLRYSFDTETQDTSVEVETWHVSRVSLSQRCLWHWHLVPSRTVLFSYVFGDICRCGAKLEDVWRYLYFIHDAYRWLLATSWIFVFTGGLFRHEIHCQHPICKMFIWNPWSSSLPTSGVFCTSFFLHWRALTHPMWGRHDETTNVLRILRNAMLQIRVSEFR